jgi:hypothetical protein
MTRKAMPSMSPTVEHLRMMYGALPSVMGGT